VHNIVLVRNVISCEKSKAENLHSITSLLRNGHGNLRIDNFEVWVDDCVGVPLAEKEAQKELQDAIDAQKNELNVKHTLVNTFIFKLKE
jgi:hypothetical protein